MALVLAPESTAVLKECFLSDAFHDSSSFHISMVPKFKACMPGVVIEQHVKKPMCANFWSDSGNLWRSTAHIATFAR